MTYRPKQSRSFYDPWPKAKSDRVLHDLISYFSPLSDIRGRTSSLEDCERLLEIVDGETSYNSGHSAAYLASLRQTTAILSKNVDGPVRADREQVAWNTFCKSELNCRAINERYRANNCLVEERDLHAVLHYAQEKISFILGDTPSLDSLTLRFGPGSSAFLKNKETNARSKLDCIPTVGEAARDSLQELWATLPMFAYAHQGKARTAGGILAFVPKNAKTDRSIMIEPVLNTLVQKGVGEYLKERMLTVGINLKDQTINRERARRASMTGHLATVDLSSASDNIAYSVVLDLLPLSWVELLDTWRTKTIFYEKKKLRFELEKFSSMGNGYTFELQSMIFYALAYGCAVHSSVKPDISVFGDDIILPVALMPLLKRVFDALGFEINIDKSYADGPFRESCGGDYYEGTNIRPFYIRDRLSDAVIVQLLNYYYGDTIRLSESMRSHLISLMKPVHRVYGPPIMGDGHIHSEYEGERHNRKNGHCGFKFFSYRKVGVESRSICLIGDDLIPYYTVDRPSDENELFVGRNLRRDLHQLTSRGSNPLSMRGGEDSILSPLSHFGVTNIFDGAKVNPLFVPL